MKIIKNIFRVLVVSACLFGGVGCSDFLDADDPSTVTLKYYDTKEGQEKLIINLYARYRSVFTMYPLQHFGTDMYLSANDNPTAAQFDGYDKDLSGLSPYIDSYWRILYKIVQESNILLNRCTPEVAGEDYRHLVGQATFFRVMAYYYLTETFGGVPLLVEENTSAGNVITEVTKESEQKIYDFMISELKSIDGFLPSSASAGKLTDVAVRHFLGKLYLTRAYRDYAESDDVDNALKAFSDVMSLSHYKLQERFEQVFDEENQGNSEIIWSIQYGSDKDFNGGGNPLAAQYGFNITALYPGMFALDQKEYSAMQRDIWTNPVVHEWFRHPEADCRYEATFRFAFEINDMNHEDYGKMGIYMPHWNDESGDTHGAKYFYPFKNADGQYNWYPATPSMGWVTDCMPMCRKFKETKIEWGGKGTREDVVFRVADTYLLAAEAYLLKQDTESAANMVNVLLERAASHDAAKFEKLKLSAAEMTIDRLLEERACEMFGEHDRWFDLKRTGTLLSRALLNPRTSAVNNISAINRVRPIPYNERIKLKGLEQNEGYKN